MLSTDVRERVIERLTMDYPVTITQLPTGTTLVAADDHWKRQPRDPSGEDAGQLVKSPTSEVTQALKKVTPAVIYKKLTNDHIVAESPSGDRRMRWDADRKKFITEKRAGDGWSEVETLGKGQAYVDVNDTKNPDKWVESGQKRTKTGFVENRSEVVR